MRLYVAFLSDPAQTDVDAEPAAPTSPRMLTWYSGRTEPLAMLQQEAPVVAPKLVAGPAAGLVCKGLMGSRTVSSHGAFRWQMKAAGVRLTKQR